MSDDKLMNVKSIFRMMRNFHILKVVFAVGKYLEEWNIGIAFKKKYFAIHSTDTALSESNDNRAVSA